MNLSIIGTKVVGFVMLMVFKKLARKEARTKKTGIERSFILFAVSFNLNMTEQGIPSLECGVLCLFKPFKAAQLVLHSTFGLFQADIRRSDFHLNNRALLKLQVGPLTRALCLLAIFRYSILSVLPGSIGDKRLIKCDNEVVPEIGGDEPPVVYPPDNLSLFRKYFNAAVLRVSVEHNEGVIFWKRKSHVCTALN